MRPAAEWTMPIDPDMDPEVHLNPQFLPDLDAYLPRQKMLSTELHLSHRVTLRAFLRLVAFCFLMAFVSIYPQIQGKNINTPEIQSFSSWEIYPTVYPKLIAS